MNIEDQKWFEDRFARLEEGFRLCVTALEGRMREGEKQITVLTTQISTVKWVFGVIWIATTAIGGAFLEWVRK